MMSCGVFATVCRRRALSVICLALLLVVLPVGVPVHGAGKPQGRTVVVQGQGVLLALTVPRTRYPQNALIWVALRLRNISNGPVGIVRECGETDPVPQVLDRHGRVVYPPAIALAVAPSGCTPSRPAVLAVHGQMSLQVAVVLRGPFIQAAAYVAPAHRIVAGPGTEVRTPRISLTFSKEKAPSLSLSLKQGVSVDVHPPAGMAGPLYAGASYLCRRAEGGVSGGIAPWKREGRHIVILAGTCRSLVLHVAAGWPGHPVATLDYQTPSSRE